MLLKLLRLHLQSDPPGAPILKVSLGRRARAPARRARRTLSSRSPDPEKLELTVARLANLVGDANIGSPELVDTHRPGEFRIRRFRLRSALDSKRFARKQKSIRQSIAAQHDASRTRTSRRPFTAFRTFRPASPAKVDLRDARPARVSFNGHARRRHGRLRPLAHFRRLVARRHLAAG